MNLAIAFCLIFFIFHLSAMYKDDHLDLFDFVPIYFLLFSVGLIITILLPANTYQSKESFTLITMKDGSNSSGSFFLGTGSVDGVMKHTFYYQEKNGDIKLKQIDASDAIIRYGKWNKAILHYEETLATDSWINYISYDFNIGDDKYLFEVPKGTIKTDFVLDAE